VTITGLNFSIAPGATTVHFGSAAASNVHCTTTQLCMATTPPGISIVHVTVTVAGLTSVTPALFSYVPVVTSVTPNKGPETGRTTVTITGAGFASTQFSSYPSVAFGSNATLAPPYCPTATSCIVASPAGIGVVDVFVTVDGQTSSATLADHFTYAPAGAARGWTQWNLSIFAPGALAYDTIRHAALAYAWTLDTGAQTFTWSAAGTPSWMAHNPVSSPQVGEPMMAFDEARGKAVLFGGLFVQSPGPPPVVHPVADTWLWDGSNWQQLALTTFPSRRVRGSMVFDGARQKIVLFGGCSDNACASLLNDTWTFDGTAWTREQPANSPPARHNAVMAYDPVNATIVLFGGATASGITNDQWTWNGVNWIQSSPAVVPAARQRAGMAYSRRDGGLVLFGGAGLGINLNDTWIWNGIQWTQSHPASSPDGGSPVEGMTYDSALDLDVVLLGGGTWTWGGN